MHLLIIGPLDTQISTAAAMAKKRGARVSHAPDVAQGMEIIRAGKGVEVIMADVREDITALVGHLQSERIAIEVVACGSESDSKAAVKAIKAGAREYIPLPPDEDLIAAILESITEESHQIIHGDPAMERVIRLAEQIAPSDANVMITGESGTGKEVISRFIHQKSRRNAQPFVAVNCAAIPENLLESELFGHEKGAFTGAVARRIGKFEEASGGTLLLDEITEMDVRLQAKLLRVLQENEIERVGGNQPVKVNLRVLATSNRELRRAVEDGVFREDLMFRLNVITIHMPALRDRPEDIPLLARYFIEKYALANGVPLRPIADDAMEKLLTCRWRGNVRELENTMHRAVLLAEGSHITAEAILLNDEGESGTRQLTTAATDNVSPLPSIVTAPPSVAPAPLEGEHNAGLVGRSVATVERDLILGTLDHCLGNRTHAANILGISIRTLRNKLNEYQSAGYAVPPAAGTGG